MTKCLDCPKLLPPRKPGPGRNRLRCRECQYKRQRKFVRDWQVAHGILTGVGSGNHTSHKCPLTAAQIAANKRMRKQIRAMRTAGKTYREIGEHFGISKQRAKDLIPLAGYEK